MSDHLISFTDAESDLLSCSAYLAEAIQSRDGRAQAMMAVVPQYLAKDDVDTAAELANTVDDPFVRDRLLIAVAEKCAAADDDEYALQLVDAIEDFGLQSQARERIGLQLAANGKFEKAREVADTMDHRDTVLAGIAVKQHVDGDQDGALKTVGEIGFPGSAVHSLLAMAAGDIEAEEFEKSAQLLENVCTAAEDIEHDEEKVRAFIDIGNSFIAAKRNDRAVETLDKARSFADVLDNTHRDNFLSGVSLGFLRAGSLELADRTLDSVTDKTQIASCLLGFAREFWRRDEKTEAFESLEEAYAILRSQHEKETRDSKAKFALFTAIAVQFAGFEKGERAIGIAQEIADENESMNALGQIAQILTIQKNDEVARQALNSIRDDVHRMFALIRVSDVAAGNDENEKAAGLLEEAYVLAEGVPQMASRSAAFIEFAKRFLQLGNSDRAREISLENLQTISTIRDESTRAAAIANLAELYEDAKFEMNPVEQKTVRELVQRIL
jgi:tetratricopeptide (TPR) repeat protein